MLEGQSGKRAKEPKDWGFNYPDWYVEQSFELWYLSGYKVMPRSGGMDDQDPLWVQDMRLCLRLLSVQMQPVPEVAVKALEERQKQNGR